MTDSIDSRHWVQRLFSLFCLMLIILMGCGKDDNSDTCANAGNGNIDLRLSWQTPKEQLEQKTKAAPPSGDICADFAIEQIQIRIKDASGQIVDDSGLLQCSLHKTQFDGIAAGTGYRVEVEAFIGDQIRWSGDVTDVVVTANQTTDPIMVEMTYHGEEQAPPTATISPADRAINIHTGTAVTISFDKAMVGASLNTNSIVVTNGGVPITGTVAYNPDTRQAIFQPDQELTIATTYTVKVTTEVMDQIGHNMAQALTSQFTTSTVWFVDQAQAASGGGKSWDDAISTIGEAIAASADGDLIWVKQGTYILTQQIVIDKPVWLLGGFEGSETQHHQRDWANRPTLVDVNKGQFRCFYISADATVDGFTMIGGPLQETPIPEGGAIYVDAASPQIHHCIFNGNPDGQSGEMGGAIYIANGDPSIIGCTFDGNYASSGMVGYGGAIYNDQGGPQISHCVFKRNHTLGGLDSFGGAIYNKSANSNTRIQYSIFLANYTHGESCYGGAIYNTNSVITIQSCQFISNVSKGDYASGGAIHNNSSDVIIQNSVFHANLADNMGNKHIGGAISNNGSNPVITNCTIYANEAIGTPLTDQIYAGGMISVNNSAPTITNSIIWANRSPTFGPFTNDDTSTTTISFSNIDESPGGNQNISKDPRFGAAFHLRADSPCIGMADNDLAPALDMDGEIRPQGDKVDMGADEFLDLDGDGMPDHWENLHTISTPTDDDDADGISNLDEFYIGTDPQKAQSVLDATDRGSVPGTGEHQAADQRTQIGDTYRSFIIFDVSGVTSQVTAAAIRLELAQNNSTAVPETVQVWDVTTAAATFASDTSGTTGVDVYKDIGSGTLFGKIDVNPSDSGTILHVQLNRPAIEAINKARSGAGSFIIGLSAGPQSGPGHLLFSEGSESRTFQLVVSQ